MKQQTMNMEVSDNTHYVLDTTVLLFDPNCLFSFPQQCIHIPISVIEELDQFRHQVNESGRHARQVVKMLDDLKKNQDATPAIKLQNGSLIHFWVDSKTHPKMPVLSNMQRTSNRVLSATLSISDEQKDSKVILVSNDSNLRLRANTLGISCLPFFAELEQDKNRYEAMTEIAVNDEQWKDLLAFDYLDWSNKQPALFPNQQVVLCGEKKILTRYHHERSILKKIAPQNLAGITPRNMEQIAAIDLLTDESVEIVVLIGKAGTGKTLLALAAGLENLLKHTGQKILVSRPIVPMGKDLGYLPGDIEEKISPWMKPIFDNLEFILTHNQKTHFPFKNLQTLKEKGLLELEALTYIRGRSIPNRYMLIDEAQNLTPLEVKTIITRVGNNTKLVLTGDPFQIDNPYVDFSTNGLSYVLDKLKPYKIAGHIYLMKGERSQLAELAANVL